MAKPPQPDLVPEDGGPVPEENRPGHHPEVEQDKPPLDRFAEALGVVPEGEEPPSPEGGGSGAGPLTGGQGTATEPVRAVTLEHPARPLLHRTWTTVADALVLPALGLAGGAIEALEKVVVRTRDPGAPPPPVEQA